MTIKKGSQEEKLLIAALLRVKNGNAQSRDAENIAYAKSKLGWNEPKLMTIWQPRTGDKRVSVANTELPVGYQLWEGGNATHEEAVRNIEEGNKKLEESLGVKPATVWDPDTGEKRIVYKDPVTGEHHNVYNIENYPNKKIEYETKPMDLTKNWDLWTGGLATGSDARAAIFKRQAAAELRKKTKLDATVSMDTLAGLHGASPRDSNYWKQNPNNVLAQSPKYVAEEYGGYIPQNKWHEQIPRRVKIALSGYNEMPLNTATRYGNYLSQKKKATT